VNKELSVEEVLRRLRAAHAVRVNRVPALAGLGTVFSDAADLIEALQDYCTELEVNHER
jgi:hypothetical protein